MADNHFKVNRGLSLVPQSTAPANPSNGDIYYDSGLGKFRKYENGSWSDLASASSGGTGDDLNNLIYRVSFAETFDQPLASSNTINTGAGFSKAAGFNQATQLFTLAYDASKTVSTSLTSATLSGTPGFTVTTGCMVIAGGYARRIVTVNSQTSYVLNAAFPADLAPGTAACVSEAVHTVDLNNYAGDGLAPSAAITTTLDNALVDYEDTLTSGDIILDTGVTPHVAFDASADNTNFSAVASRTTNLTDTSGAVGFTAGSNLYLRFFANKSSGTGTVNLLGFKAYWHSNTVLQNGNLLNQAYAFTDSSATAINATLSTVAGKTRMTFVGFTYVNGVNSGTPNGQLDVFLNGQKLPRFVNTSITPDGYYKEIDATTIELDADYSGFQYSLDAIKRIGVVDTSSTNAARITALEAKPSSFNYILNPDAETGTGGWVTFADAAATTPQDGTGGTPNVTLGQLVVNPLRGSYSFQLAKDAANRQGQGVSYDFTIDLADTAKVLQISFDYSASSNFVFAGSTIGDVQVWLYDKTNNVLIQPAAYTLDGSRTFNGRFQTNSNSTSYRLIFFIGSTNALAYTLNFENVKITPQTISIGAAMTDWRSDLVVTPNSFGTITSNNLITRRAGDSLEIKGRFQAGTVAAAITSLTLPSGMTIDYSKLVANAAGLVVGFFNWTRSDGTSQAVFSYGGVIIADGTDTGKLYFSYLTSSGSYAKVNGNALMESNQHVNINVFGLPILGWSSTVQMSNDTDTRVVAFAANANGGSSGSGFTDVTSWTTAFDTHGAFASSTTYTIPVAGFYEVYAQVQANSATATIASVGILQNGSIKAQNTVFNNNNIFPCPNVSTILKCNAGDTLKVQASNSDGVGIRASSTNNIFTVQRLTGPSVVASTESINCKYFLSANSTPGASLPINFDTRVWDTHGAVTTGAGWKFTAPVAGKYHVDVVLAKAGATASDVNVYKNGVSECSIAYYPTGTDFQTGSTVVSLNAGDTIDIRGSGASTYGGTASQNSHVSIFRVGS